MSRAEFYWFLCRGLNRRLRYKLWEDWVHHNSWEKVSHQDNVPFNKENLLKYTGVAVLIMIHSLGWIVFNNLIRVCKLVTDNGGHGD